MNATNARNKKEYHNFIDGDPYMNSIKKGGNHVSSAAHRFKQRNAFNNCCCAATGEQATEESPAPAVVKNKVHNIQTLQLAKTVLAIVGLYVVTMYVYKKFKK
jgi:hypothetical protein